MADNYVIEMLHITKEFPGIKANDDITLQLRKGEIHALLGENGAGKSTLMSVLKLAAQVAYYGAALLSVLSFADYLSQYQKLIREKK